MASASITLVSSTEGVRHRNAGPKEAVRMETMVERIVIVGAGGHGREIVALAAACNLAAERPIYDVVGVVDDGKPDIARLERLSVPLIGPVEAVGNLDARFVIGIGSPSVRRAVDKRLLAIGALAAGPMVHPLAWIGPDVELSPGVIVCAGAIVTTNVRIGRHAHLNLQATVSHDCRIGEYVTVAPMTAICGNVTLEDEVELGTGVSVVPAVTIGRGAMVGAGAVVTGDIAPGMVAVGVPARSRPR
jgi:sugar O-acyltransferase (sialic acid O-acetyltransferase NeuD family)